MYNDNDEFFASRPPSLLPGGYVRSRDPSGSLPGLASIRQLPGAGVRRPPPDRGHAGGAPLRHGGACGPRHRHVRPQHGALQAPVQPHREVHAATQTTRAACYIHKYGHVNIHKHTDTESFFLLDNQRFHHVSLTTFGFDRSKSCVSLFPHQQIQFALLPRNADQTPLVHVDLKVELDGSSLTLENSG